jgi:hypothetical protein
VEEIPLDDGENIAFLTPSSVDALSDFSVNKQREFLNRIITALESQAISTIIEKPFQDVDNLQQLRVGDKKRVYCLLVEDLHGYNVLFVFGWSEHKYQREKGKRHRFNEVADHHASKLKDMSEDELEEYISEGNFFTAEDLKRLRDKQL